MNVASNSLFRTLSRRNVSPLDADDISPIGSGHTGTCSFLDDEGQECGQADGLAYRFRTDDTNFLIYACPRHYAATCQ
jgi:hypothetical protein